MTAVRVFPALKLRRWFSFSVRAVLFSKYCVVYLVYKFYNKSAVEMSIHFIFSWINLWKSTNVHVLLLILVTDLYPSKYLPFSNFPLPLDLFFCPCTTLTSVSQCDRIPYVVWTVNVQSAVLVERCVAGEAAVRVPRSCAKEHRRSPVKSAVSQLSRQSSTLNFVIARPSCWN